MRLEHWNANTGYYRQSDGSGYADSMTRAYGRLIAAAGAFATPAPLRGPDDPWRLHVLAHPHGPRVLKARIVAPDELPIAVLAAAEGGEAGQRRAWHNTVSAAPRFIDGCDPGDFRDRPDSSWVIMALLPALAAHPEAVEWLGDVEQCIAWAFLESLQPMTTRHRPTSAAWGNQVTLQLAWIRAVDVAGAARHDPWRDANSCCSVFPVEATRPPCGCFSDLRDDRLASEQSSAPRDGRGLSLIPAPPRHGLAP